MTPRSANNNLLALGSAAVLAVYSAGYVRTKPAADRLAAQSTGRRRDVASDGPADAARDTPQANGLGTVSTSAPVSAVGSDTLTLALHDTTIVLRDARTATAQSAIAPSTAVKSAITPPPVVTAPVVAATATPPVQSVKANDAVVTPAVNPPVSPSVAAAPATKAPASAVPPAAATAPAAPTTAPAAPTTAPASKLRDGMFLGRGTSRHGDIEAMVEIVNGRVVSAVISQCLTRYSCSWIADLPPQVVSRQSPDVDNVSGATERANAFYYAIRQALQQAK